MLHHVVDQSVLELEKLAAHVATERLQVGVVDADVVLHALPVHRRVAAHRAAEARRRVLREVLPETELVLEPLLALVALHPAHLGLVRGQVVRQVAATGERSRANVANEVLAVHDVGDSLVRRQPSGRRVSAKQSKVSLSCCVCLWIAHLRFAAFVAHVRGPLVLGQVGDRVGDECAAVAEAARAQRARQRPLRLRQVVLHVVLQYLRAGEHLAALRTLERLGLQVAGHVQGHRARLHYLEAAAYHVSLQCVRLHVVLRQIPQALEVRPLPGNIRLRQWLQVTPEQRGSLRWRILVRRAYVALETVEPRHQLDQFLPVHDQFGVFDQAFREFAELLFVERSLCAMLDHLDLAFVDFLIVIAVLFVDFLEVRVESVRRRDGLHRNSLHLDYLVADHFHSLVLSEMREGYFNQRGVLAAHDHDGLFHFVCVALVDDRLRGAEQLLILGDSDVELVEVLHTVDTLAAHIADYSVVAAHLRMEDAMD